MTKCMWTALFALILVVAYSIAVDVPIKSLQECVKERESNYQRKLKRKLDEVFVLDYGDPAIEVFNILSNYDLKRVEFLASCIQNIVPNLFEDKTNVHGAHLIHAGSNVTYMTGILQVVYPDIMEKVVNRIDKGLLDESEWKPYIGELGVRTIQYLEYTHDRAMPNQTEIDLLNLDRWEKSKYITLGGGPDPIPEDELPDDLLADEFVVDYIDNDQDSAYTLHTLVNDRNQFFGGTILVKKYDKKNQEESSIDTEDEDMYDDEYELQLDKDPNGFLWRMTNVTKPKPRPKFNALTTKVARYTPERGGFVVIKSGNPHGAHTVTRGRRLGLMIEMWPYADAPIGSTRLKIEEATPLPRRKNEL